MKIIRYFFTILFILLGSITDADAALVADYHFDECGWDGTSEEIKDSSGNNRNGISYNNTIVTLGKINHSGYFTNNGSYNNFAKLSAALTDVNINSWTFTCWIKIKPDGTWQPIYFVPDSDNTRYGIISLWYYSETDNEAISLWVDDHYLDNSWISINLNDNKWHFITVTYDGSNIKLYIDDTNNLTTSYDRGSRVFSSTNNFYTGIGRNDTAYTSNMYIDEVKIFNTVLSSNDTNTIYNNEKIGKNYDGSERDPILCSVDTPPKVEYRFDECNWNGTLGEVKDSMNNYHATAKNGAIPSVSKINFGANVKDDKYIELINTLSVDTWSVTLWVNFPLDTTKNIYVIGSLENDGDLAFFYNNDGDIIWGVYDNNQETDTADFPDNLDGWHHLTFVNDKSSTKLYIDGRYNSSVNKCTTGNLKYVATSSDNLSEQTMGVYIDEYKIFDRVISEKEVQIIYKNDQLGVNYDGSTRDIPTCSIKANYHFDECLWNGTEGEVKDSSQNSYNGTAKSMKPSQNGFLNNDGNFTDTDIYDYISLNHQALNGIEDFTITTWFKTSNTNNQALLSGANSSTANEIIMWFTNNTIFTPYIKNRGNSISIPDIADNLWHMITMTRKSDEICVYIDDDLSGCATGFETGALTIDSNGLILGQEQDSVGGDFVDTQSFIGYQDELKIFSVPLTSSQIRSIYYNELSHKNYDGSHRMAIDCTTPVLLAEYKFDECKYNGTSQEVVDSVGGDNSGTIPDFNTSEISTVINEERLTGRVLNLNGGAVDIDNLAVSTEKYKKNTVMFWMKWAGVSSLPFGWKYYNLWTDYNNIVFNTGGGDKYGSSTPIGYDWHHIVAVFTNGDVYSNRLYIDGVPQILTQLEGTPNDTKGYCQSSARIGGWLVNEYWRFKDYLDEVKIYRGEVNATTIAEIYNNEKNLTRTITCSQALLNAVNQANGCFNWENNITTKIAGSPIELTILSADKNDNNNSLADVNVTKLELLSFSDASCSTLYDTTEIWSGNEEVNSSACFNPSAFTHNKAVKCAKIKITGIYEGSSVEANSTDTFSIRPDSFRVENIPLTKLIAEHDYIFQAKAVNSDKTTLTADYNTSVTPQNKKYFRDGNDGSSMAGAFLPTNDFVFSDGVSSDTTLSFNNVGIISLELNDTTWAEVDSDDTPLADRIIYLEQNLTFIPKKFAISFDSTPTMSNHDNKSFTYYANDLTNMGANLENLSFKVRALGEKDTIMTNYQNTQDKWFANNSLFTLNLSVEQNPTISSNINENATKDLNFSSGIATLTYADLAFNFTRERNVTKNPIKLDGSNSDINITVTDSVDSIVTGTILQPFNGSSTFYYGRLKTTDIKTFDTTSDEDLTIEVYWDGSGTRILPTTFKQKSSSWYINQDDDAISIFSDGDFTPMKRRKLESAVTGTTLTVDTPNPVDGSIGFSISTDSKSKRLYYHIKTPVWLWYSRYEDYDFTLNSTCAQHPCFEYIFQNEDDTIGIKSGDYNGTRFENSFKSGIKKKAIKLMR